MGTFTNLQIAVLLTAIIVTFTFLGIEWHKGVKRRRKEEFDAYMAPRVYTAEDQEELDKEMDKIAEHAAESMYREYCAGKNEWRMKFGDNPFLPFINIPIIPPYASIIIVHPSCKSRHEDGGFNRVVMDLYYKKIKDGQSEP